MKKSCLLCTFHVQNLIYFLPTLHQAMDLAYKTLEWVQGKVALKMSIHHFVVWHQKKRMSFISFLIIWKRHKEWGQTNRYSCWFMKVLGLNKIWDFPCNVQSKVILIKPGGNMHLALITQFWTFSRLMIINQFCLVKLFSKLKKSEKLKSPEQLGDFLDSDSSILEFSGWHQQLLLLQQQFWSI